MKNLRNFIQTTLVVSSLLLFSSFVKAQTPSEWEKLKDDINVFMVNDMGRNGYYDQKPIAELNVLLLQEIFTISMEWHQSTIHYG